MGFFDDLMKKVEKDKYYKVCREFYKNGASKEEAIRRTAEHYDVDVEFVRRNAGDFTRTL